MNTIDIKYFASFRGDELTLQEFIWNWNHQGIFYILLTKISLGSNDAIFLKLGKGDRVGEGMCEIVHYEKP